MTEEVKLSRIVPVLDELDYPISRSDVVDELGEMTVLLADGEVNFGDLIGETNEDSFASQDDLALEVMNLLPRRAVGEPYQSEGEG
jgi:hypothetical protein